MILVFFSTSLQFKDQVVREAVEKICQEFSGQCCIHKPLGGGGGEGGCREEIIGRAESQQNPEVSSSTLPGVPTSFTPSCSSCKGQTTGGGYQCRYEWFVPYPFKNIKSLLASVQVLDLVQTGSDGSPPQTDCRVRSCKCNETETKCTSHLLQVTNIVWFITFCLFLLFCCSKSTFMILLFIISDHIFWLVCTRGVSCEGLTATAA